MLPNSDKSKIKMKLPENWESSIALRSYVNLKNSLLNDEENTNSTTLYNYNTPVMNFNSLARDSRENYSKLNSSRSVSQNSYCSPKLVTKNNNTKAELDTYSDNDSKSDNSSNMLGSTQNSLEDQDIQSLRLHVRRSLQEKVELKKQYQDLKLHFHEILSNKEDLQQRNKKLGVILHQMRQRKFIYLLFYYVKLSQFHIKFQKFRKWKERINPYQIKNKIKVFLSFMIIIFSNKIRYRLRSAFQKLFELKLSFRIAKDIKIQYQIEIQQFAIQKRYFSQWLNDTLKLKRTRGKIKKMFNILCFMKLKHTIKQWSKNCQEQNKSNQIIKQSLNRWNYISFDYFNHKIKSFFYHWKLSCDNINNKIHILHSVIINKNNNRKALKLFFHWFITYQNRNKKKLKLLFKLRDGSTSKLQVAFQRWKMQIVHQHQFQNGLSKLNAYLHHKNQKITHKYFHLLYKNVQIFTICNLQSNIISLNNEYQHQNFITHNEARKSKIKHVILRLLLHYLSTAFQTWKYHIVQVIHHQDLTQLTRSTYTTNNYKIIKFVLLRIKKSNLKKILHYRFHYWYAITNKLAKTLHHQYILTKQIRKSTIKKIFQYWYQSSKQLKLHQHKLTILKLHMTSIFHKYYQFKIKKVFSKWSHTMITTNKISSTLSSLITIFKKYFKNIYFNFWKMKIHSVALLEVKSENIKLKLQLQKLVVEKQRQSELFSKFQILLNWKKYFQNQKRKKKLLLVILFRIAKFSKCTFFKHWLMISNEHHHKVELMKQMLKNLSTRGFNLKLQALYLWKSNILEEQVQSYLVLHNNIQNENTETTHTLINVQNSIQNKESEITQLLLLNNQQKHQLLIDNNSYNKLLETTTTLINKIYQQKIYLFYFNFWNQIYLKTKKVMKKIIKIFFHKQIFLYLHKWKQKILRYNQVRKGFKQSIKIIQKANFQIWKNNISIIKFLKRLLHRIQCSKLFQSWNKWKQYRICVAQQYHYETLQSAINNNSSVTNSHQLIAMGVLKWKFYIKNKRHFNQRIFSTLNTWMSKLQRISLHRWLRYYQKNKKLKQFLLLFTSTKLRQILTSWKSYVIKKKKIKQFIRYICIKWKAINKFKLLNAISTWRAMSQRSKVSQINNGNFVHTMLSKLVSRKIKRYFQVWNGNTSQLRLHDMISTTTLTMVDVQPSLASLFQLLSDPLLSVSMAVSEFCQWLMDWLKDYEIVIYIRSGQSLWNVPPSHNNRRNKGQIRSSDSNRNSGGTNGKSVQISSSSSRVNSPVKSLSSAQIRFSTDNNTLFNSQLSPIVLTSSLRSSSDRTDNATVSASANSLYSSNTSSSTMRAIKFGEGLVGTCAQSGNAIVMLERSNMSSLLSPTQYLDKVNFLSSPDSMTGPRNSSSSSSSSSSMTVAVVPLLWERINAESVVIGVMEISRIEPLVSGISETVDIAATLRSNTMSSSTQKKFTPQNVPIPTLVQLQQVLSSYMKISIPMTISIGHIISALIEVLAVEYNNNDKRSDKLRQLEEEKERLQSLLSEMNGQEKTDQVRVHSLEKSRAKYLKMSQQLKMELEEWKSKYSSLQSELVKAEGKIGLLKDHRRDVEHLHEVMRLVTQNVLEEDDMLQSPH